MRTEMQRADEACGGLDVVYANAGVSASVLPKDISTEKMCRTVMDINVTGILNTVFPVYDRFIERKRGQYVIIASIAGIGEFEQLILHEKRHYHHITHHPSHDIVPLPPLHSVFARQPPLRSVQGRRNLLRPGPSPRVG